MQMQLAVRPDYGTIVPWVEAASDGAMSSAGPDAFRLTTRVPIDVQDGTVKTEFVAGEGARERFALERGPRCDEGRDVGDRVVHAKAARSSLQM